MTNAISSISSSAVSNASSSSSSAVTEDTKKKLKALGLDPSKYKTETEAQSALTEAQEVQAAQKAKPAKSGDSAKAIQEEITSLAANLGITAGSNDKISDIMDQVSSKIDELTSQAGNDPSKKSEAENYKRQYSTISNEFTQMQAAKNMTGATAMANYTKYALGLG